ncbi:HNH endonuclease signature motif containing protein [Rhizobium rhizogenes]|uniref:HNH endonuclease signature motif containing protein n=1 Tax=Rhizobium rhizogenes TaxID=359 RepID=UPI00157238B0|nr:HNH endonuclease [Rhizobium rhizogenes]NTI41601.1 HNH endonuclease [Rhizobium rhizogenes]
MPTRAPRICGCGAVVLSGTVCRCQERATRERKARFDKKRPSARQRGYTAEWERESRIFLTSHPVCRRCSAPATTVDHIKPHKGDMRLFWDRNNWQPLCSHHHNSAKQSEERRSAQEAKP